MSLLERLLAALREHGYEPRRTAGGWTCRCPAHNDRNPSLSIGTGEDGRALVKCHAGCETAEVVAAIGLALRDLMPDSDGRGAKPRRGDGDTFRPRGPAKAESVTGTSGTTGGKTYSTAREAVADLERHRGERAGDWTYRNATGEPVGLVLRWDGPKGKSILPVSLNCTGWRIGAMPEPRPVYRLPELATAARAEPVYVCEGEKAADAARALGLVATTSPGGGKAVGKADWSPLAGRDVVVLPDHDAPGEEYAAAVVELAYRAGARTVRVVRLVDHWRELPEKGDLADVLELADGDAGAVRAAVETLAEAAEPEELPEPPGPAEFRPFPVDVLPEPIRSFVREAARAIGCDASYVALPMLSALASAIGNTRRLRLKRAWDAPAILWTVIVGESGTVKSPALASALRWVRDRQHRAMRDHAEAMKAWEVEQARYEVVHAEWKKKAAQGKPVGDPPEAPAEPVCARTWTDDATTEALVARLQENPRGLLMARDELAAWFAFDRYTGGRGGSEVARWLEVFEGRALMVDRKTTGTEYVPRAAVSIAGGIQPETLRRSLVQEHRDSGLAARLLFAMPPRMPKRWTEDDVRERTEAAVAAVFDRLYALEPATDADGEPVPLLLDLDAPAKRRWVAFVNEHGREQAERVGDEAAAWAKLEGYAARLALVLHLTRAAAGDPTLADRQRLDEASMEAAMVLVRWFAREAERVYALLSGSPEDRERARLLEWIASKGGTVTARQLSRGPRPYKGDGKKAEAALAALVEAGIGRWEAVPGGRTRHFRLARGGMGSGVTGDCDRSEPGGVAWGDGVAGTTEADGADGDGWGEV